MEGVNKVKVCELDVSKMGTKLTEFESEYPSLLKAQQKYQLTV